MNPSENAYLGLLLKNWAARLVPPVQCRGRLLWLAAHASPVSEPPYMLTRAYTRGYPRIDWSSYLQTWGYDQAFPASLAAACIMV